MKAARRSKQSGVILVFTLAVLTAVVAVLVIAASMQKLGADAAINRLDQQRAEIAAESGIQSALSVLAIQSTTATSQNDPWYNLGDFGQDRFLTDDGTFRLQILDAASFINLNGATQTELQNLPLQQNQVDSLLDWENTGSTARPDGAKDDYYNSLTHPYNTAETSLHSLDELLQVNNFTPATLFTVQQGVNGVQYPQITLGNESYQPTLYDLATVDSTTTSSGAGLTNVNSASAQQLIGMGIPGGVANAIYAQRQRQQFTTLGAVLRVPGMTLTIAATVLNRLTVTTGTTPTGTGTAGAAATTTAIQQPKVDLNTANQAVLMCIPGVTSEAAQAIITRQSNSGFTSLGQVTQVPGVTLQVLQQSADSFTINSQAFIVRVIGTAGNVSVPLEAVITLGNNTANLIKIYHPPFNDMRSHWHWDNQSTNDVDLRTGQ
jgi:DNA uptake protein ComE-like DNA-binding protein